MADNGPKLKTTNKKTTKKQRTTTKNTFKQTFIATFTRFHVALILILPTYLLKHMLLNY